MPLYSPPHSASVTLVLLNKIISMSRKYKFRDQSAVYFVSFATVYWIDIFSRLIYRDILVDAINYCIHNKGLIVYAWCIMTSHVHMIIGTEEEKLQDIMRDLKGFSARKILKAIEENQQGVDTMDDEKSRQ